MLEANQWGDLERISEEFTLITLKTEENTYWKDYEYGWPIQKLRPWIEVAWSTWWSSLYATIEQWTQSIPNNVLTTLTWLSTISGNAAMTATADQITITQSWFYLLNAYCFIWWNSAVIYRILKNWVTITPHYRLTTSSWASTPYIIAIENFVVWDNIKIAFYQNSGSSQTLQNARLSVSKI
jgi:hypothetical protein